MATTMSQDVERRRQLRALAGRRGCFFQDLLDPEELGDELREAYDPADLRAADIDAIARGTLGCNADGHDEMTGPMLSYDGKSE